MRRKYAKNGLEGLYNLWHYLHMSRKNFNHLNTDHQERIFEHFFKNKYKNIFKNLDDVSIIFPQL